MIITADRIITGTDQPASWVSISDESILSVGIGDPGQAADLHIAGTLIPGLVDIHSHGAGGFAFETDGADAAAFLHRRGVTTTIASLVSAPVAALRRSIDRLAPLVQRGVVAGIHLEGPAISPARKGAHDPSVLTTPAVLEEFGGVVRMVTLAPELPGAMTVIKELTAAGTAVALGHSDADGATAAAAFDAGARLVTHLFNAMPGLHHRQSTLAGVALLDERVHLEVICDGFHVNDDMITLVDQVAPQRWIAVSDGCAGAGLSEGRIQVGGLEAEIVDGAARLADGTLAGSAMTLDQVFPDLVARFGIERAVAACSTRPAAALGLSAGAIAPGLPADLIVWDGSITRVMRRGTWL